MGTICDELIYNLAQPPARSGLRLKSERELAGVLNVHYQSIKYAMSKLEQGGVVERRRGSGTFLRKVPSSRTPERFPDRAAELFLADAGLGRLLESDKPMRPFEIALWGFHNENCLYECQVRDGIRDYFRRDGHNLTVFAFPRDRRTPQDLAQALTDSGKQFDAALVFVCVADAYKELEELRETPVLYLLNEAEPTSFRQQPLADCDQHEMFERTVQIFAENDYRRVGLLTIASHRKRDFSLFERACGYYGIAAAGMEAAALEPEAAAAAVKKLFPADDRAAWPEALFCADDILLHLSLPFLQRAGVKPGGNVGIVTQANAGLPLPGAFDWSRLEFDPYHFGRTAAEALLKAVRFAGEKLDSFASRARWIEGNTLKLKP